MKMEPHPAQVESHKALIESTPKLTGNIIRRIREISGTSQGELARSSAANLSYISSIESGRNNISIKKVLTICNALNLSPNILINILILIELSAMTSVPNL